MRYEFSRLISLAATLFAVTLMAGRDLSAAESINIDLTQWSPSDIATVEDDPFGRLVKYGHALFTDTANEIGPAVSDPTRRFTGNNLACQNCHLQAGNGGPGCSWWALQGLLAPCSITSTRPVVPSFYSIPRS